VKFATRLLNFDPAPGRSLHARQHAHLPDGDFPPAGRDRVRRVRLFAQRQSHTRRRGKTDCCTGKWHARLLLQHRPGGDHRGHATALARRGDPGLRRSLRRNLSPVLAHSRQARDQRSLRRFHRSRRFSAAINEQHQTGVSWNRRPIRCSRSSTSQRFRRHRSSQRVAGLRRQQHHVALSPAASGARRGHRSAFGNEVSVRAQRRDGRRGRRQRRTRAGAVPHSERRRLGAVALRQLSPTAWDEDAVAAVGSAAVQRATIAELLSRASRGRACVLSRMADEEQRSAFIAPRRRATEQCSASSPAIPSSRARSSKRPSCLP
jgi:hypothetical protein